MARLLRAFDLLQSQAEPEAIDAAIRKNARFAGVNLWVLFFAILIASIGLNVNSTAVIIGAMLISPLMGPILGIGYGAGIGDARLIRSSALSLLWFMLISLGTATLYFLVSPLDEARSELLARTSPTIWDVLIAFFGGCAGIVAITRREVSTVVPGVAIATALMPPLCTAGFGIASGQLEYFAGAFYLFTINSVFIAFATLLFVGLLRLPQRADLSPEQVRRTRFWVAIAVIVTVAPSTVLTFRMLKNEVFLQTANRVITSAEQKQGLIVLARNIDGRQRSIELTVGGERVGDEVVKGLAPQLEAAGIGDARLSVRYSGSEQVDLSTLREELQHDVADRLLAEVNRQSSEISALRNRLSSIDDQGKDRMTLMREIRALYPHVLQVESGEVSSLGQDGPSPEPGQRMLIVLLTTADGLFAERDQLLGWLNEREDGRSIRLHVLPAEPQEAEPEAEPEGSTP